VTRRLTRSRNAIIGGVAAGVAEWINTDPALVRIAWALLVPLTQGAALLAYIVAWVIVPEAPRHPVSAIAGEGASDPATAAGDEPARPDEGRIALLAGAGLVVLGLWFLLREYLPDFDWGFVWPLLLVGAGALILVTASRRR
jgi:phage shock protein C